MQNRPLHIIFLTLMLLAASSAQAAVKKNTWVTRAYHYTTARYNTLFNGKQAFEKGDRAIWDANKDNYTQVIPLYAVSNHDNASVASSDMDRAIAKSEKTIKLHSIVKKPKKNPRKARDPKYKEFMAKEEYNPMVQEAWLLMGKAQFYKLDFLAANATFSYITKHFKDNKDVFTEATLWTARAYAEMGWYYEAEDVLNKMNEKTFTPKTNQLFVCVKADLLLKQEQYTDAVPYLKTAIEHAPRRQKARRCFILAQVLERLGKFGEAYEWYTQTIKSHPLHELEFNATLNQAQCYQGKDTDKVLANLRKLLKKQSNADYQDQIYFAIAELYLRQGDERKAAENYRLAIENSTRDGIDKAKALLALGGIHYQHGEYLQAQPLYNEALPIIPLDYPDYKHLDRRTNNLNQLAEHAGIVQLEDSLQQLASLPENERVEKIKAVIAQKKAEEAEAQRKLEEQARIQEIREQNAVMGQTGLSLGENGGGAWYFYNPSLVSKGKVDFQRTWGRRTLEDDWRRSNKMSVSMAFDYDSDTEEENESTDEEKPDNELMPVYSDDEEENTEIQRYMRMLPMTEEARTASDNAIREALYQEFVIYDDRIEDRPMAIRILEELERRFPDDPHLPEAHYRLYKNYQRNNAYVEATETKEKVIREYPDSKYARILQGKATLDEETAAEQEALYRDTYAAFKRGDAQTVRANATVAHLRYPDSKLIPKYILLDAMLSGSTEGKEAFKTKLNALIRDYPDNEATVLAKDMVALLEQGKEIQSAATVGSISEQRVVQVTEDQFAENLQKAGFAYDPDEEHHFILLVGQDETVKNKVLFAVASYNFTRFLIKDFDLSVKQLDEAGYAVTVSGLANLNEAVWYQNAVLGDSDVQQVLSAAPYKCFAISKTNYRTVFDQETLDKYLDFYRQNHLEVKESDLIQEIEQESGFVKENTPNDNNKTE